MSQLIDIRDLPSRLDEVLASAAAGVEILLTDGVTPRARLVPLTAPRMPRPGLHPGAFEPSPDFDAPLPDEFWTGQT